MELAILMDTAGTRVTQGTRDSDGPIGHAWEIWHSRLIGHARQIWPPGFRGRARGGPRVLLDSAGPRVARECVQSLVAI